MKSSVTILGRAACRLLAAGSTGIVPQSRSIVHKSVLRLPPEYPDPWPYKEKGYNYIDALRDRTQSRFHQNSKLIVVEGNIGVGKSKLSAELADQLGFYYMPEFKMEDILIDRYGNDLRKFYHLFPESFRMPDMEMFYKNPMSDMSAKMQQRIFECRFDQYLNAVAHILNTGQGVVLERTPYSDFVFVNAMRSKNYVGHEYLKHYYYVRKAALPQLHFWPHLVVYLDAPVHKCLENIRARGNANEIAAVDETYLGTIEDSYKDSLKEYRRHSKILAYDWTRPGDADTVVEDIERLDFDFFEWHSGDVMEEWFTLVDEVGWNGWRQHVTSKVDARLYAFGGMSTHEVGELYINPRDAGHFMHVMRKEVLKSPHGYGFITKNGDPMQGLTNWRTDHYMAEPWYEYYYKEAYYDDMGSLETSLDPHSDSYDPDYVHHHH
ncbi:deoxynucleoside kinase [Ancylostoma caninum]|uniref:NADH dehydrogenase [ubiquinone] 1 alpha subcomplex subunit 10, mitochondrial n=1 Tax=Ancylostoma caninum TaxID=29170 RepID=A0A368GYF2_ANCCA|nr:deoxynucleoside kinase [Ancylostoma caninum]